MAEGRSNQAIGEALFLSHKTIETYTHSIFMKLDLEPGGHVHRRVLAILDYLQSSAGTRDGRPAHAQR